MKTSALLMKVLLAIACVVLLESPVLGYQIEFCGFEPGIEAREDYHAVAGMALSPDEETLYAAHWQAGIVQSPDPIGVYLTDYIDDCSITVTYQLVVGGCVGDVIVCDDGCCVCGTRYYGGSVHCFDTCNANSETTLDLGSWANTLWKTPDNCRAIVSYNAPDAQPSNHHHLAFLDITSG